MEQEPALAGLVVTRVREAVSLLVGHPLIGRPAEERLHGRWGILRANRTVDPAAIHPIDEPIWLLDLDMFRVGKQPFDAAAVVAEARSYAERIYCFFRWAVTPAFLDRYGGAA